MIQKKIIQIVLVLIPSLTFGQNLITGRVVDSDTKKPVKNAVITIDGTNVQTMTNYLGFFQLSTDSTKVLTVAHDGYEVVQIKVPSVSNFQIQLIRDIIPDFQGGINEFYKLLGGRLKYPPSARNSGTQGRVYVSFDVDSLKGVQNIKIIKDIGNNCAPTVSAVLNQLPNYWIPKSKLVTLIIPVTFKLGIPGKIDTSSQFGMSGTDIELPMGKLLNEIIVMAPQKP